ncbi:MAG: bifunctional 3,4-dihydroxy-2-butanone 4-phosphate synthase/GTP cyclohydrolase II [Legionellales bacterium RIFCSPHIGHO2_12_FULL_35_11]|nr:MAG: bifunctional 3,4-dihydroxy-2-butanone 4-phosphate synthase/GTP cyclohydrolase II [Legionellales bacterium RIFCSPHIGHO2_12_FULL_35_11]
MTHPFSSIEDAITAIKNGKMIILLDDENRENEGDLVIAAEHASADSINFMSKYGRGLICLPMAEEMIDNLDLPMMTQKNGSPFGTAFTVSIEAASGVTTGISAQDRAKTIQVAIDKNSTSKDLISPGHVFPLKSRKRGVLERAGQTEGSVDLMKLAGLTPAAVICEIINEDGSMSRRDQLIAFAKEHDILLVTIHDLIEYRVQHEKLINVVATTRLPIEKYGDFTMILFKNDLDAFEHFALVKVPTVANQVPLVRIHSECITGDVFSSTKCDCGSQLNQSLAHISREGGVVIYLRQEGRGVGLTNKLKAYSLQEQGYDTVEANVHLGLPVDSRNYAIAYQILKHLGIEAVRLLTNNPHKIAAINQYGVKVVERVPVLVSSTKENAAYLKTKQEKLGHLLAIGESK